MKSTKDSFLSHSTHGIHTSTVLEFLLGNLSSLVKESYQIDSILDINHYPGLLLSSYHGNTSRAYETLELFQHDFSLIPTGLALLPTHDGNVDLPHPLYSDFFTPEFLARLRLGASCEVRKVMAAQSRWSLVSSPTRTRVRVIRIAAHIRKGDVDDGNPKHAFRYTDDRFYFDLFDALVKAIDVTSKGTARVESHAFTSCNSEARCKRYQEEVAQEYLKHNVSLHVDSEIESGITDNRSKDLLVAWSHFISADIFIMAVSSFSHVPALFNPKCVLYQPMTHAPLGNWIVIDGTIMPQTWSNESRFNGLDEGALSAFFVGKLRECLQWYPQRD